MNRSMQLFRALGMLALLAAGNVANAQECTTCWTPKCDEALRSYLPACPPPKKTPPKQTPPKKKEPAGVACPDGRMITKDTAGQCCWAGQVWNGSACVGVPTSCPKNLEVNVERQECAVATCKPGKVRAKDGVHCCWPGQEYASTTDACVGIPSMCPPGFKVNAAGQKCDLDECGPGLDRSSKNGPCCWPGQSFDNTQYACVGPVMSCMPGYSIHPNGTMCIPAPCGPGEVRASDDFHCCYPGQDWKKNACVGTPTVCPDGYEVDRTHNTCAPAECKPPLERAGDGIHCCMAGQEWNETERACTGRPRNCPAGMVANANGCAPKCDGGKQPTGDAGLCCYAGQRAVGGRCAGAPTSCPPGLFLEGESCLAAECPVGMTRAADDIHCCWPGQGWSFERGVCQGVPNCPKGQVLTSGGNACEPAPPPPNFAPAPAPSPPPPQVEEDRPAKKRQARKPRRTRDEDEEDDEDLPRKEPSSAKKTAQRVVRGIGITVLSCGLLSPVCCLGWCGASTASLAAYLALNGAWFQYLAGAVALAGYATIPLFVIILVLSIPGAGAFALVDYFLGD